jgi:hypothetical protein
MFFVDDYFNFKSIPPGFNFGKHGVQRRESEAE